MITLGERNALHAVRREQFVATLPKQPLTLHAQDANWYAYVCNDGSMVVVLWDLFLGVWRLAARNEVSASKRRALNIR